MIRPSPLKAQQHFRRPFDTAGKGRSLAFFATGKLKKVDTTGGVPQVLGDAATGRGGAWSTDGTIAFAPNGNSPLARVAASGGAVTPLTTFGQDAGHAFPHFLPDGRHFLYFQRSTTPAEHSGLHPRFDWDYRGTLAVTIEPMGVAWRSYDASPDGQRFLLMKKLPERAQDTAAPSFVVVQHWFEELMRLAPAR